MASRSGAVCRRYAGRLRGCGGRGSAVCGTCPQRNPVLLSGDDPHHHRSQRTQFSRGSRRYRRGHQMTAATARWFCLGAAILFLASLLRALGTLVVVPLMITASVCWISGALNLAQSDTPVVRTATFGAFGLRWVLALLLYWASLYHWPLLPSLQVGNGFWYFCMDALNYHAWAPRIMTSLAWGLPV